MDQGLLAPCCLLWLPAWELMRTLFGIHSLTFGRLHWRLHINCMAISFLSISNATDIQRVRLQHGRGACPCVGIDNLQGHYTATLDGHVVKYPAETGSSCGAWENGRHPDCQNDPAEWCRQRWCYIDPCNCNLEILPKLSKTGVKYQGMPAYWSYDTCGSEDKYTKTAPADACSTKTSYGECTKLAKCGWDGKRCSGKELVSSCKAGSEIDEITYGQADCRCVGLTGRNGQAKMHLNAKEQAIYSVNVGGTCAAWEQDVAPECLQSGEKPAWCFAKWCFVDPCKCRAKVTPKALSKANKDLKFNGRIAYRSYSTCGSEDSWSTSQAEEPALICSSVVMGATPLLALLVMLATNAAS